MTNRRPGKLMLPIRCGATLELYEWAGDGDRTELIVKNLSEQRTIIVSMNDVEFAALHGALGELVAAHQRR